MCGIMGAILKRDLKQSDIDFANRVLADIWFSSHDRGRDGRGYVINSIYGQHTFLDPSRDSPIDPPRVSYGPSVVLGNLRAEPTTEFVKNKQLHDQQPYSISEWSIVHNGTIANDKELRTNVLATTIDSAAIVEQLDWITAEADALGENWSNRASFRTMVYKLKGSYAILAANRDELETVFAAVNYRPIWYAVTKVGTFFASSREYFSDGLVPQMLEPYTLAVFSANGLRFTEPLLALRAPASKALVVCSGGLDSVVAATVTAKTMETELIHFRYGSRAEGPEIEAVKNVAEFLKIRYTIFDLPVYKPSDSPLLNKDSEIVGGEEGAEFAHEWVPARNLLLLSVASAYAEANGFDTLVLGNNLEEAGAYPDNEPEFIARFNDLLPFAIGDGKRLHVEMPVGNLMKHEIVALGHVIRAPMHLTWSCYRNGSKHCGKCGPCFMRRTAFKINNLPEVIEYDEGSV